MKYIYLYQISVDDDKDRVNGPIHEKSFRTERIASPSLSLSVLLTP